MSSICNSLPLPPRRNAAACRSRTMPPIPRELWPLSPSTATRMDAGAMQNACRWHGDLPPAVSTRPRWKPHAACDLPVCPSVTARIPGWPPDRARDGHRVARLSHRCAAVESRTDLRFRMERVTGIEPALSAWELAGHAPRPQCRAAQRPSYVVRERPPRDCRRPCYRERWPLRSEAN